MAIHRLAFLVFTLQLAYCQIPPERDPSKATITDKVFFNISIGEEAIGQIVIGLFGDVAPRTVLNFKTMAEGKKRDAYTGRLLTYKNSIFHRIIKGFICQGGDIISGDGYGFITIYGTQYIDDEPFTLRHSQGYLLSTVNRGPNTNGCQFSITAEPTPWLNGKHVVYGRVLSGFDVYDRMNNVATDESDRPYDPPYITASGTLPVVKSTTTTTTSANEEETESPVNNNSTEHELSNNSSEL